MVCGWMGVQRRELTAPSPPPSAIAGPAGHPQHPCSGGSAPPAGPATAPRHPVPGHGWGRLGTLEPLPQVLQELNVTVVTFLCRPQNVCTYVPQRSTGICFVRTGGSGVGTAGTAPGRKGGRRGPSPAFSFLSSPSGRWAHPCEG